jgi:hypothetical protein
MPKNSKDFSEIKLRILQFVDYIGVSMESFCRKISTDSANFRGKSAKSDLGSDKIVNILREYREISPDWLLLGEGQMIRANKENLSVTNVANIQGNNNNNIQNTDNMLIDSLRKAIEAQEETIKVQRDLITSLQDEVFCLNRDQKK